MRRHLRILGAFLACVCAAATAAGADAPAVGAAPATATIRVMSFNLRYAGATDGDNAWERRTSIVLGTIRAFDPDLLGCQEATDLQVQFLSAELTGYALVSAGRDDGKRAGEHAAIFYKIQRFTALDAGHFWLSETPHLPASMGWDAAITRLVSWVRLVPKDGPRENIFFFNTHFDHRGPRARQASAELLRRRIDGLSPGAAAIVAGDFNADAGSAPYEALVNPPAPPVPGPRLLDTYRAIHPERADGEGTFHGFTGTAGPARIDWILCSDRLAVRAAAIDRTNEGGRYPSDHFPVTAVLELGPPR
jgi:endonuclease/exonuclease/phosphatase family metal-dependent hydrolase